jgi:NADH:ubiquinone reductase (non-electrogenic)
VLCAGDAANIEGHSLLSTAEVAVQKATWLAKPLTGKFDEKKGDKGEATLGKASSMSKKTLIAYIGRQDGIVEGKGDWTGKGAWLAWRSGSLEWTRSWRRRAMIVLVWVMNKLAGREVARR